MKKIKLNSNKLKLKKESIGSLLNKETMGHVIGGDMAGYLTQATCQNCETTPTVYPCTKFTVCSC